MSDFVVVPIVTMARGYRVRSKSEPGLYHITDLSKATCTCRHARIGRMLDTCEHMKLAVEFERLQHQLQQDMPLWSERLKREAEERRARAGQRKAA